MLLSAESATTTRVGTGLYQSYLVRLMAIFGSVLMVFALAVGVNVPAAQAQDEVDIPGVSDVADPAIDTDGFADPAEVNTGDLADLPEPDAKSPATEPSTAKPATGGTYEEDPEQWCIENYDSENPGVLAEKCPTLAEQPKATTARSAFSIVATPAAANEQMVTLAWNEWREEFTDMYNWYFRVTPTRDLNLKRFQLEFTTPDRQYLRTHNGSQGYEYAVKVTLNGVQAPTTATIKIVDAYRIEIILAEPVLVRTGQNLRFDSKFVAGGYHEISSGYNGYWAYAYPTAAYVVDRQQPLPDVGQCDSFEGSSLVYWYSDYYGSREHIEFTPVDDGTIKKLTLNVDENHNVWPSSSITVNGRHLNSQGGIKREFNAGEIKWARSGNNLEFVLPDGVAVEAGDTIRIRIYGINSTDLYYYGTEHRVSACGNPIKALPPNTDGFEDALPNPPTKKKCGQKIALIFDLSNSIERDGVNGLQNTKDAGEEIVKRLTGTPTELGIYNFASDAPRGDNKDNESDALDLQDPNNAETLTQKIKAMTLNSGSWEGGTNWEGALKRVKDKEYDTVYLVTDGEPTAVNGWRSEWASGTYFGDYAGDPGRVTHFRDINKAIIAANALKDQGTRVETIGVNLTFLGPEVDVLYDSAIYRQTGSTATWIPDNKKNSGFWGKASDSTDRPGAVTVGDYRYYKPEAVYKTVPRLDLLSSVSGPTLNEDWFKVDSYADLAKNLADRVLKDCESKLIVKKKIRLIDGDLVDGAGWTFKANAYDGAMENDSVVTQITDPSGNAMWHYKLKEPNQTIDLNNPPHAKVTVEEVQQPGYALELQDGKRAKCTRWGEPQALLAEDPNSESGFAVKVDMKGPVVCEVINKQLEPVGFSLKKVGFKDGRMVDEAISTAEFTLFKGLPDGSRGEEVEQKLAFDSASQMYSIAELPAGDYYIVETKSAPGYQLLPKPIRINIDYKRENGKLIPDGQGGYLTEVKILDDNNTVPADVEYIKVENGQKAVITLANYEVGNLPRTGGPGLAGFLLSAMMLIGAAMGLRRKLA